MYILNRDPWITDIEVVEYRTTNIGEIYWNWIFSSASGGRIFFYTGETPQEGIIFAILPGIGCCINLGDLIDVYGEPDYAYAREITNTEFPTHQNYVSIFTLVWLDQGFRVKGYPQEGTWRIDENFQIESIAFFFPTWEGFLSFEGNTGLNALPWQGYNDASNYVFP